MSKLLFGLIKTLNKSEKRLFNDYIKNYKRKSDYLKLIKVYSSFEAYSIDLDEKVFKSENSAYKISCKNSFKSKLLRFLSEIKKKNVKHDIQFLMDSADVLINRFFYKESLKTLNKALVLSLKYEAYSYSVQIITRIIQIEVFVCTSTNESYIELSYFKELQKQRLTIIDKLIGLAKVEDRHKIEMMTFNTFNNPFIKKRQKEAIDLIFCNSVKDFKSLEADYYKILRNEDYKESLNVANKLIAFLEKDFKMKRRGFHEKYPKFVSDAIIFHVRLNLLKGIPKYIKKYDLFEPTTRLESLKLIHYKTASSIIYALENKKFDFPKQQIQLFLIEFKKLKRNKKICQGTLFLMPFYFLAINNLEQCEYTIGLSSSIKFSVGYAKYLELLQAILIFEKKDMVYLDFFLMSKFKKKESKLGLNKPFDFLSAIIKVFKSLIHTKYKKATKNMECVYELYFNFAYVDKYFIYYFVNKFPQLQNDTYRNFLKAKKLKHIKIV